MSCWHTILLAFILVYTSAKNGLLMSSSMLIAMCVCVCVCVCVFVCLYVYLDVFSGHSHQYIFGTLSLQDNFWTRHFLNDISLPIGS